MGGLERKLQLIIELSPNKKLLTLVGDDKESRIKTFSVITFK